MVAKKICTKSDNIYIVYLVYVLGIAIQSAPVTSQKTYTNQKLLERNNVKIAKKSQNTRTCQRKIINRI